MATADKRKIKEDTGIYVINAPGDFEKNLGKLPKGSSILKTVKEARQIHWFVKNKAQLEKEVEKTIKLLKDGMVLWIYYPKTTSGIQTDLTRDKGWDKLLAHKEMQWLSLISFDDTWSAFACRMKTEADLKKESKPRAVSYTHLRAHETVLDLVCRLLLEKKKQNNTTKKKYI